MEGKRELSEEEEELRPSGESRGRAAVSLTIVEVTDG